MPLNYHELFKEMAKQPQVIAATKQKAEQLRDYIELRWPDVNDLSEQDKQFLEGDRNRVVQVTEATQGTNRATHVVTVRHPGAVAKQAKSGFLTKAVKDVQ